MMSLPQLRVTRLPEGNFRVVLVDRDYQVQREAEIGAQLEEAIARGSEIKRSHTERGIEDGEDTEEMETEKMLRGPGGSATAALELPLDQAQADRVELTKPPNWDSMTQSARKNWKKKRAKFRIPKDA